MRKDASGGDALNICVVPMKISAGADGVPAIELIDDPKLRPAANQR